MDYMEGEELSWRLSWSNSLWQGWSCRLVHCPAGNATDKIWRMLASSGGISCWIPLYLNIVTLSLTLTYCPINSGVLTSFLLPHLSSSLTDYLPSLNILFHSKTDARLMQDGLNSLKHYIRFCDIFPSLKYNFIAYRSSKLSYCIFEIHQLWQSGFSRF